MLAYLDTEGSWEEDRLSEFIFLRCSSPSSSLSHLTSKIAHFRFGIGINDRNASSRIEYLAVKKLDALRTLVYCFTPSFDASSPVPSSLFSSPSIPEFSVDHIRRINDIYTPPALALSLTNDPPPTNSSGEAPPPPPARRSSVQASSSAVDLQKDEE